MASLPATPAATAPGTTTVSEMHAVDVAAATPQMDPRLMRAHVLFASGSRSLRAASASTTADELAVIAKVSDLAAWNALSEVHTGVVLGGPAADGSVIATARIPLQKIEAVRAHPFVVSLKAAQPVYPALKATLTETQSRPADLPKASGVAGARGVVVGVVDFGCDFVHRNFRSSTGKTRLLALWNQEPRPGAFVGAPADPSYGHVHRPLQLNAALKTADPYAKLGYRVGDAEHGTHVLDIAAGNGLGTGAPGMAPSASLVFVQLAASDVPWGGTDTVGASFGDSVQLLEAVKFVFDEAGSKPCVVNLSLGTNGGPHDGSTLVEQGIDRLIRAAPNRAVVIAASNSQGDGIHAMGTVAAARNTDLKLTRPAGAGQAETECELWFAGSSRLTVELLAPGGQRIARAVPGGTVQVQNGVGRTVGVVSNRLADPNNGDNTINVWWAAGMPTGEWTLRLSSTSGTVAFHAWLERNDSAQASFSSHRVDSHTLGTISTGQNSIVVASYDAHKPATPLSWFSSTGPTRDGRQKPEVSAPGHDVVAARSTSINGSTRMSGTSMAAPATAGLVALLLARAKVRKLQLTAAQTRQLVINSCRRNPPSAAGWDAAYGHGRISGQAAVAQLMSAVAPPVAGKKAVAKKAAAKKVVAKKVVARKVVAKKVVAKKAVAKRRPNT